MSKKWTVLALAVLALAGVARAEGDLVATAKWEAEGVDIDLAVLGPGMKPIKPDKDVTTGPGKETCTVTNPGEGVYLVAVFYAGPKGGQKTVVAVDVRLGDKAETTTPVVLDRPGEGKIARVVTIGQADLETIKLGAGDISVTLKWETQGSDVDLGVIGPNLKPIKPEEDVTSGPGQETCTLKAPKPGIYLVAAQCAKAAEGQKTPISVTVRVGEETVGTYKAVLDKQGEGKVVRILEVPEAPAK